MVRVLKAFRLTVRCSRAITGLAALVAGFCAAAGPSHAQTTPQEPAIRLIRSTSGSKGHQDGARYLVDDPRTVFTPADDRQVIVYFEWEGRPGLRHCEGRWKDPTGKVVLVAPVDYEAKSRRFGVYWTLALPETVTPGLWALEVSVDREPAGTHTFEIAHGATAAARSLSAAELYARALAASAVLERLGPAGELLGRAPATAVGADQVVTPFGALEGTATLRLRAGGRTFETQALDNWDRRNDWALVRVPAHGLMPLPPAESGAAAVGDRCFALDSLEDGSRVIGEASIVGEDRAGARRLRLNSGFAAGSPVLDERGALIGLVSAGGPEATLGSLSIALLPDRIPWVSRSSLVIPLALVHDAPAGRATSLPQLMAGGVFARPLSADQRHVISGVFASHVERGGAVPMPQGQKSTFSQREGQASVFVQWNPQDKRDAQGRFEVYDLDNKVVARSAPSTLKLRRGELFFSTWVLSLAGLAPDVYRVDCLLDEAPVWRGYLRVTE